MEGEFPQEIKCPVCLGVPYQEIFQCRNGHIVCRECSVCLEACPQCRVDFEMPKIRSRALENLLDMMKFDCAHKSKGCIEKTTRKEYYNHAKECYFSGTLYKLCAQLGYSCEFPVSTKGTSKTLDHFREEHRIQGISNSSGSIFYHPWNDTTINSNAYSYKPVIWEFSKDKDYIILIVLVRNESDKTISVVPIQLNEIYSPCEEPRINFSIDSANRSQAEEIFWSMRPVNIKYAFDKIKCPVFRIPVDILEEKYVATNSIRLFCWTNKRCLMEGSRYGWPSVCSDCIPKNNFYSTKAPPVATTVDSRIKRENNTLVSLPASTLQASGITGFDFSSASNRLSNNQQNIFVPNISTTSSPFSFSSVGSALPAVFVHSPFGNRNVNDSTVNVTGTTITTYNGENMTNTEY